MSSCAPIDISLVFNVHDETKYLRRTLSALDESIKYGEHHGLSFELIVVLDQPDALTRQWIDDYDFAKICSTSIVECRYGSLGPARNHGISIARGDYIATVDADDLVSFNMFAGLHLAAQSAGRNAIAMQNYILAFGAKNFLVEYFGTDTVNKLGFFSYHPGVSRILAHRSLFEQIEYADTKLGSGYAYEDWNFSCEALSRGYEYVTAENTILFYRQRRNSLLQAADQHSVRQTPPTALFQPRNFLGVCGRDYKRFRNGEIATKDADAVRRQFDDNRALWEIVRAAASIDPAITMRSATSLPIYTNLSEALNAGSAYFRACSLLGERQFTDVVLLPFLSKGGGDKYILDVIGALSELDPDRSFLVLSGEPFDQHAWMDRLPDSARFIDIYRHCRGCTEAERLLVTLRLIENFAPSAVLHLKSSVYAVRFIETYHAVLNALKIVFYRFSDHHYTYNDIDFCAGYVFDFISEHGERFWKIITDNATILRHDTARFDSFADRWVVLKARCVGASARSRADDPGPATKRILWASRLDPEKRPDLLIKIAAAVQGRNPELSIDVFGTAATDHFDVSRFEGLPNVIYRGGFSSFSEIDSDQYDAFLYTTAFDGLPNVVLEAMASGLPVIAPDIGGIAEVVKTGETGWLLDPSPNDETFIARYCDALGDIYAKSTDLSLLRRGAIDLVSQRHSAEQFLDAVGAIFACRPEQRARADAI